MGERPAPDKTAKAIGTYLSENVTAVKNFAEYLLPSELQSAEALQPGEGGILIDGLKRLAACRDREGTLHIRSGVCTHLGCHVNWNSTEQCWDWPCHGSQFAPDGAVLNGPGLSPLEEAALSVERASTVSAPMRALNSPQPATIAVAALCLVENPTATEDFMTRTISLFAVAAIGVAVAAPAWAASDAECQDMWKKADANGDGVLSDKESIRYVALMRVGDRTIAAEGKITQAEFMDACKADIYAPRKAEQGAPLKGSNSFTEGQAKDRAIAHGEVDSVAGLKKDDDGIWRGTGTQAGKTVQIAVDYKGNVVTTAQQ